MNSVAFATKIRLGLKYPRPILGVVYDKIVKKRISNFPRLISLFVTNKCNLNCPLCLNADFRTKNINANDITIEIIKKILPELKRYKPFIYIGGGEPLINTEIFKIINLLSKNKIFTSMATNGLLLHKYVDEIINSKLEFISISLDHFEPILHNRSRGGIPVYDKLINGIDRLLEKRKATPSNIKINTVVNMDNHNSLSKMHDFIESLNVDEWSIQHPSFITQRASEKISNFKNRTGIGDYVDGILINGEEHLEKEQVEALIRELNQLKKKRKKYDTKLSIRPKISDLHAYYRGDFSSKKSYCSVPFQSLSIGKIENSKVVLCMGYEIGDLNKGNSLKSIWKSEKAKNMQKSIMKEKVFPPCFRCCSLNYEF